MTTDNESILEQNTYLVVESLYNQETDKWEVSSQDCFIGMYYTEEEAAAVAVHIHLAFETGYINGLLLAYQDKPRAKQALEDRGIQFRQRIQFDE